jgi:lactoylglutathione lyase
MLKTTTKMLPTRILYTMIRVYNLEKALGFYVSILGMKEFRREEYTQGRFTLVFIGYGDEESSAMIELTYNWDISKYKHGTRFGHIAIGVEDIYATCQHLESMGVNILRKPGPMLYTATNNRCDVIAFIEDPDNYKIELIENN